MSKPDLLLLDEPFSNIDQSLKEEIQVSVKKLLKRINLTTIIVTHDSYEAFSMADKCGIILDQELKQYDVPYNVHHEPNSIDVANFLNKGIFIDVQVVDSECAVHRLKHDELGEIRGKLSNNFPSGSKVKLLLQPEDLIHDDQSKLKLEVVDRKFRGTNFIYTLKTKKGDINDILKKQPEISTFIFYCEILRCAKTQFKNVKTQFENLKSPSYCKF